MLYATTRNPQESYTPAWALRDDRAPDGGFFVPFRAPYFDYSAQKRFREQSFLETVAEVLNSLLGSRLTCWDLLFGAGKSPVTVEKIGRHTYAVERFRNPHWEFSAYVEDVCRLLEPEGKTPGHWAYIAVSAAVLTGILASFSQQGILKSGEALDIAVDGRDYRTFCSCLYLKTWGLPIGRVICAMEESKGLWALIHDGEMQTDVLEPDSDTVDGLEEMLAAQRSQAEVKRFLNCVRRGKCYVPSETLLRHLRGNLGVSMISPQRIADTIPAIYGTHNYFAGPRGALAYAGLLDYRAVSGSGNGALVLMDRLPDLDLVTMADSLGLGTGQTEQMLKEAFMLGGNK